MAMETWSKPSPFQPASSASLSALQRTSPGKTCSLCSDWRCLFNSQQGIGMALPELWMLLGPQVPMPGSDTDVLQSWKTKKKCKVHPSMSKKYQKIGKHTPDPLVQSQIPHDYMTISTGLHRRRSFSKAHNPHIALAYLGMAWLDDPGTDKGIPQSMNFYAHWTPHEESWRWLSPVQEKELHWKCGGFLFSSQIVLRVVCPGFTLSSINHLVLGSRLMSVSLPAPEPQPAIKSLLLHYHVKKELRLVKSVAPL